MKPFTDKTRGYLSTVEYKRKCALYVQYTSIAVWRPRFLVCMCAPRWRCALNAMSLTHTQPRCLCLLNAARCVLSLSKFTTTNSCGSQIRGSFHELIQIAAKDKATTSIWTVQTIRNWPVLFCLFSIQQQTANNNHKVRHRLSVKRFYKFYLFLVVCILSVDALLMCYVNRAKKRSSFWCPIY